jgi:hypothetical protein
MNQALYVYMNNRRKMKKKQKQKTKNKTKKIKDNEEILQIFSSLKCISLFFTF